MVRRAGASGVSNVMGVGSAWVNTSIFYVGYRGEGLINIGEGGRVTSPRAYIADMAPGRLMSMVLGVCGMLIIM